MKADLFLLEFIVLKNAINEIERDIAILEEQRQLRLQIGRQLTFDFHMGRLAGMTRQCAADAPYGD
jgi:hypothetical protein